MQFLAVNLSVPGSSFTFSFAPNPNSISTFLSLTNHKFFLSVLQILEIPELQIVPRKIKKMNSVKGKFLKKLKTMKTIGYLKAENILLPPKPPLIPIQVQEQQPRKILETRVQEKEPEMIDVSELMRDLEDAEMEINLDDKENIGPNVTSLKPKIEAFGDQRSEIDVSSFRRPDLNSFTLFDPNLLAAFEQAVMVVKAQEAERMAMIEETIEQIIKEEEEERQEPPSKLRKMEENTNPLLKFPEKCPPGGSESVILYTTGLRGVRKTFEDCQRVRFLLENFRVLFFERDVSMHTEYRDELWRVLGGRAVPPRLFIRGRYIGAAEEVVALHEQGRFRPLLEGIPVDASQGQCDGCGGVRFVMCFRCSGSTKIVDDDGGAGGESMKCPACNENGLIVCPMCSLS
ncbi:PREDICTED: uncharacterized protein At3g28850-like [Ipomoea nil]|uniref:uncharacterized protein At3g28850-like n=1 Tax=Ipomoea nil TaxID=35883 RepID=UPI000901C4E5|nr:PREDICTED: uncharacterized protein At3g28850-like [Ipomoea nil]